MANSIKTTLGRTTLVGFLWLMFQSGGARVIGILTQLVLAKLLAPEQFGLIGLVYTVTSLSAAIVNFGVDGVLLQRHRSFRLWITPAFWASLCLGVSGLAIVSMLSTVFAHLYRSPQLTGLAVILALSMPLGALSTVPTVLFRMRMEFKFPAIYQTVELFAAQLGTVVLAALGFGALSFVLPTPVMSLVRAVVYWWRTPVRLTRRPRIWQMQYLLRNGLTIFGTRIANEFIAQGDYAVLGLTSTHYQVGIYFFAFRLAAQPLWTVAGNFSNVLFPALVHLKGDPAKQLASALRSARLLSYVALPVCFYQGAVAGPFLQVFFGHKWLASIPLVRCLSVGMGFDAATWVAGSLLSARRNFGRALLYAAIKLPSFLAMVWLGATMGKAYGVALAVMAFYVVLGPTMCLATFGRYGATRSEVLALYLKPPLLAGVATAAAFVISLAPPLAASPLLRLIEISAVAPVAYLALMAIFAPEPLKDLRARTGVNRALQRLRLRLAPPQPSSATIP